MDKLEKQLIGRYKGNKVRLCAQLDYRSLKVDPSTALDNVFRDLAEEMGNRIVQKAKQNKTTNLIRVFDPDTIGDRYEMIVYCFSEQELLKLIDDSFRAGEESVDE
jgi:hypothetical protein